MYLMPLTFRAYLLAGARAEVERLRIQARAWEPEVETMLNEIGVEAGWRCLDVDCGPVGIIGPLARRTGRAGAVVALDNDPVQLQAVRQYAKSEGFENVEFVEGDLFSVALAAGSFDLVHARFILAPLGRDQEVLDRLTYFVRDGGLIALEEPDPSPWSCHPPSPSWERLKRAVLRVFEERGGDLKAGVRLGSLLLRRGLEPVGVREATVTLPGRHPYSSLLVQLALSLRLEILSQGLLNELEFQDAIRTCQEALHSPYSLTQTFRLVQAWGRVRQPPRTMV